MKLLIYEFITGGGLYSWPATPRPSGSLLAEGAAMLDSLQEDCERQGHDIHLFRDARLPLPASMMERDGDRVTVVDSEKVEREAMRDLAGRMDGVILIAPEVDGALRQRAEWVESAGGRLCSPSSACVALAADKRRCSQRLSDAGVATARCFDSVAPGTGPWISKPHDGCGSLDIQVIDDPQQAHQHSLQGRCVEHPVWGWPVSVGALCGPAGVKLLSACEQHLNRSLSYVGGATPLSLPGLASRAVQLAQAALDVLTSESPWTGFVGIDLVVSGEEAAVIEVNPRLTTSYVGLSQWYGGGLADAMLQIAQGAAPSDVTLPSGVNAARRGNSLSWTASGYWEWRETDSRQRL